MENHYQLFPKNISFGARARNFFEVLTFRLAPEHQMTELDVSWLKEIEDPPEGYDLWDPEQQCYPVFAANGAVYDPEIILDATLQVKKRVEKLNDVLPAWYAYQIQLHGQSTSHYSRSVWMVIEGELWSFRSDWNLCVGTPVRVTLTEARQRYHECHPQHEEDPDRPREIHEEIRFEDFPDTGLEGHVLGLHLHGWKDALEVLEAAQSRSQQQKPPDRIFATRTSHLGFYRYYLDGLIELCQCAIQHEGKVVITHSY